MAQSPRTWWLGRLDAFLSEAQRQSPPGELGRYRLLVGATLLLLVVSLMVAGSAPFFEPDVQARLGVGLGLASGFALALVFLRRWGSLRAASLLVCGLLVGGYMLATFAMPSPAIGAHATIMLIPALSVYLLGVRTGLLVTGFFCLNAAVLLPLYLSEFGARAPLFARPEMWISGVLDSVILLLGYGLSALFRMARDEAAATVLESERKLLSLIESTDDPVSALDPQGGLIIANTAARRLFLEAFGRDARMGDRLVAQSSEEKRAEWQAQLNRALQGHSVRYEVSFRAGERTVALDLSLYPILGEGGRPVGVTAFGRDITERKETEAKLGELHRSLMEVSRQAGMAEIATGVLHNVGNTLNSVNVSALLVAERLHGSRAPLLVRATDLLREHEADLSAFLAEDPRGRQLPEYLSSAARHVVEEQAALLEEMRGLIRNVEHIRAVVSMQQAHARFGGQVEQVPVSALIDDALRLHASSYERSGIRILREYAEVPPVPLDRHKLLQILVNLLNNARQALVECGREDKQLSIRVRREGEERLRIEVGDNGVGIAPENLARLFAHGFTTKKDGHGFGLHASALAAEEMNGRLSCVSGGRGQGATFIIELPMRGQEASA
ncbi:ATP-binding protein [Vitiosangium sp. GDMCC 1.1324]|uniref:ATP-binding protein n=1 Tax=Vitiosangium sp. (strain GDMCC 1.1324) TaxID=2138576 RepID=UPI000D3BC4E5|nr:ATP-binding protein [Vitiosangium sp. GDMCC 1.1324]PTL81960.1 nitrogen regulation protein NtrB [Vitiosangium sp. GDMCC 1.1324]